MTSPAPLWHHLPSLETLVDAADAGLHPWVHRHVPKATRREALAEELGFWLNTAAQDLEYAATYAANAPHSGQPAEAYLDRWVAIDADAHVLIGPRYLGRDPDLPFVSVSASSRPLRPSDQENVVVAAVGSFAAFQPGFVMLTTADPIDAWPGTYPERRHLVGRLGDLRRATDVPAELTLSPRTDIDFYERYQQIHDAHVVRSAEHARHSRVEAPEDLMVLAAEGLLFDVNVAGTWAGIVAAEPDARRGIRGATVVELILDESCRGFGHGRHLSALLAKALPMPDDQCLMGTIHAHNLPSYRSAVGAGRVDVGGEIIIPIATVS
jgi:hypothetical protein